MTDAEQRSTHLIAKAGAGTSPVFTVKRSDLKQHVRLLLFVRAGGRCQFDGCNRYLLEHYPTLREGNFAEIAHIVAFREDGPRGWPQLDKVRQPRKDSSTLIKSKCLSVTKSEQVGRHKKFAGPYIIWFFLPRAASLKFHEKDLGEIPAGQSVCNSERRSSEESVLRQRLVIPNLILLRKDCWLC